MRKRLPSPIAASPARALFVQRFLATLFLITVTFYAHAQLQLLKDVNKSEEHAYNEYSSLVHGVGRMYFVVNNTELWKSNGSATSTIRLKTFKSISNLTMSGTTLYFTADDGVTGSELWRSNGTPGNTVRVKDIVSGSTGSSPHNLAAMGGMIYFAASHPSSGTELWKSDGTSAGTVLVKDIVKGSSNPRNLADVNGTLYFSATNGSTGYELWKSNGTAAGTVLVKDIHPGSLSADPQEIRAFSGKAFFTAYDKTNGRELWISDGTAAGTTRLKDIRAGSASSTPENLTVVNNLLMFSAHDGIHGDELWKSDGTAAGTVLVKDLNPGGAGSNATNELQTPIRDFTNANGILFFVAAKGATEYIYRSDGTSEGTFVIQQASSFSHEVFQPEFTYMNGHVYFFNSVRYGEDQYLLRMPYKGNGSQVSTVRILGKPFSWTEAIPVRNEMIHFYNNLYFFSRDSFNDDLYGGYELKKSDGTYEGTVGVYDAFVSTEGAEPRDMIRAGKYVYMYNYGPLSYSPPMYRTDGTPEGTIELVGETYPHDWAAAGSRLYVVTTNYDDEWELSWTEGNALVRAAIGNYYEGTLPERLNGIGTYAFWTNELGELWRSDGTYDGTVRLMENVTVHAIYPAGYIFTFSNGSLDLWKVTNGNLSLLSSFGQTGLGGAAVDAGTFYFGLRNGEFWKTNGTPAGTSRVGGSGTPHIDWSTGRVTQMMVMNGNVYFTAHNTSGTHSLFRINGNTNIERIADVPYAYWHTVVNNHIILFAPVEERTEVFSSDGTAAGTQRITTINSVAYSGWLNYAVIGNYVYFNVLRNNDMWRTDGTLCGTQVVDLGTTENFGLVALGNDLVFGGATPLTGNEPHIYRNPNAIAPAVPCESESQTFATAFAAEEKKGSDMAFPNPFANSFTFRWDADNDQEVEVSVFTMYGMPVEPPTRLKANTGYELGQQWQKGSYILKVKTADKEITHHVIKR